MILTGKSGLAGELPKLLSPSQITVNPLYYHQISCQPQSLDADKPLDRWYHLWFMVSWSYHSSFFIQDKSFTRVYSEIVNLAPRPRYQRDFTSDFTPCGVQQGYRKI